MPPQHLVYLENVGGIDASRPLFMYNGSSLKELKEKFFDSLPFVPSASILFDFYDKRYGSSNRLLLMDDVLSSDLHDVHVRVRIANS